MSIRLKVEVSNLKKLEKLKKAKYKDVPNGVMLEALIMDKLPEVEEILKKNENYKVFNLVTNDRNKKKLKEVAKAHNLTLNNLCSMLLNDV